MPALRRGAGHMRLVGGARTGCDHGCAPVVADRAMDMAGDDLCHLRVSLDDGAQAV